MLNKKLYVRLNVKTLALAMFCSLGLTLSGCQTFEGLGKDIQKAGEAIEESAK